MSEEVKPMNEEDILEYTQRIRKDIVTDMTKGGIPSDRADKALVLNALADMDRTALGSMRIKAETDANNTVAQAQSVILELLKRTGGNRGMVIEVAREVPVLGNEIPVPEVVPGEIEQNPEATDYNSFIEKMGD